MPARTVGLISCTIVLLVGVGACRPGPDQAVRDLAKAFRDSDALGVEARLDVKQAATSLVDQVVAQSMATSMRAGGSGLEAAGTALGGAMLEGMKPMFAQSLTTSVENFARGGPLALPSMGSAGAEEAQRDSVFRLFHGIVKTEQRDRLAIVTIRVGQPGRDSFDVGLKLQRGEGGWRVVGVDQVGAIVQRLQEKTEQQALRASARSDLRNYITAQEAYFSEHNTYATSLGDLRFVSSPGVSLAIAHASQEGHAATATTTGGLTCAIFAGPPARHALAPATAEGAPACNDE